MNDCSGRQPGADLRAVLDNMTDVFFRTDRDGRLLMASRSIENLLGYPRDALLGRDMRPFYVDVHTRADMIAALDAHGGRLSGHDMLLRRQDGGTVWVSLSARRLDEDQGGGLEGILHDVTDRRRAERQQREQNQLVLALLNATTDATMLVNSDGTVLACNSVFVNRLGLPLDHVVGHDLYSLFPPDLAAQRRLACHQALASGQSLETRDMRNGRHLLNTITPVPSPDGGGWLAIFSRDITEEVEDKARIDGHLATIRRSNEELEQFAYVASHDLREPLRQISSYIGLLERRYLDRLDAEAREFLEFARNGAQRMDALILDLLAFSRVTRVAAQMEPLALDAAIGDAMRLLNAAAQGVTADIAPGLTVQGDLGQLTRLFQNLIGNALKYRAADRPLQVTVLARRDGPHAVVSVQDNGIGIDPQYFERIFRIFQRLHAAAKYEGTGIGLAIVKRVAENHGGTVTVASTPGQGSTFTIRLPLAE